MPYYRHYMGENCTWARSSDISAGPQLPGAIIVLAPPTAPMDPYRDGEETLLISTQQKPDTGFACAIESKCIIDFVSISNPISQSQ